MYIVQACLLGCLENQLVEVLGFLSSLALVNSRVTVSHAEYLNVSILA